MEEFAAIDLKILFYIYHSGEAFAKKLAARLNENPETIDG
jgi:hypothetical protein